MSLKDKLATAVKLRFRYWFTAAAIAIALVANLVTDPDSGVSTAVLLVALVTPTLAVVFSHMGRKGMFDYLDMEVLSNKASEHPIGAAIVFLGLCHVIHGMLGLFGGTLK